MEGVPLHLSLEEIGVAMAKVEGVVSVHDLHIWSLTAERIALSAHVAIGGLESWPETLIRLKALLAQRYSIEHVTLQPETVRRTSTVPRVTP
jgi:cobalt-zinc-cadmium efflux system protein